MRLLLTIAVLLLTTPLRAAQETIRCTAKVALNRVFQVELNRATRELKVSSDNGYRYEGSASMKYTPKGDTETYYLPVVPDTATSTPAMVLDVELSGERRIAYCWKLNECYACR